LVVVAVIKEDRVSEVSFFFESRFLGQLNASVVLGEGPPFSPVKVQLLEDFV